MPVATTMCGIISPRTGCIRCRFTPAIRCCARSSEDGPFQRQGSFTPACPSASEPAIQRERQWRPSGIEPAQTIQFAAPEYANLVPGVPLYRKTPYPGVTVTGTKQWLNPDAFVSVVDPTTGACYTGPPHWLLDAHLCAVHLWILRTSSPSHLCMMECMSSCRAKPISISRRNRTDTITSVPAIRRSIKSSCAGSIRSRPRSRRRRMELSWRRFAKSFRMMGTS
jgi:hypothetical protein